MRASVLAVLMLASALPGRAVAQAPVSQVEVSLELAPAAARARVLQAFVADSIALADAQGEVIRGEYIRRAVTIAIRATVIPLDSAHTQIVLTEFARGRAAFGMPAPAIQVTSRTSGGRDAWARLVALADALGKTTAPAS